MKHLKPYILLLTEVNMYFIRIIFINLAFFSVNFIIFATGICYSWTSPFLPKFESTDSSINPISRPVTTSEGGLLVSIISLGLLIGPLIPALIAEKLGKRKTLLLSSAPLLVAHIICSVAETIEVFLIARFLMGLVTGATWAITPAYIGEISEPRNRGLLSSVIAVMTSTGSLFAYCVGPFLSMKWFSILNLLPVMLFFIFIIFFVPESPYDLIKKNELKRAEQSLITLRRRTDVQGELADIKKSIEADNANHGNITDLFKNTSNVKAIIISAGVMTVNPLSGICAILGYAQPIFEMSGSSIPSAYSAIIVGFISLCTTIVHSNLVDKIGRKLLITVSCCIMSLSMILLGSFFYLKENNYKVDYLGWLPLLSLILYMIGYYLGVAAIPFMIVGELFPSNIKSVATGLFTSYNFSLSFILTLAFPYLLESIGISYTFWLIAVFLALGFVFCLTIVQETKGKSLQEITEMLSSSSSK